jgi:hypothetical protein
MSVFIDTDVFVTYINKRDSNHDMAVDLLEDIMKGKYGVSYTSDYIFDEAVTYSLIKTKDVRKALDVGRLILGMESFQGSLTFCLWTGVYSVKRGKFSSSMIDSVSLTAHPLH